MRTAIAAAVLVLAISADAAFAQRIPSSAMPGRERQQFGDPLGPPVPRIELRDGRPAPVFETGKDTRPAKRRKCRTRGAKRC